MKGQLKIQEMAFMIIAVVILFALVGLFGLSLLYGGMQDSATEQKEKLAQSTVRNLANSPEFSCVLNPNCVDVDKVLALAEKREIYKELWTKFAGIKITTQHGLMNRGDSVECSYGNINNCDEIILFEENVGKEYRETYVLLCRKAIASNGIYYEKCEVGKLGIGVKK
jgi:hypothetical protein